MGGGSRAEKDKTLNVIPGETSERDRNNLKTQNTKSHESNLPMATTALILTYFWGYFFQCIFYNGGVHLLPLWEFFV